MAASGFNRDTSSEVICRWKHASSGVVFDLMSTDPAILGFSNRWYPEAVKTATHVRLSDLQKYVGKQFTSLLSRSDIENYLPGLLTDESRVAVVLSRLRSMAA